MLTEQEVLDYLGIDYADEMITRNIARMIMVTDSYLQGSLGKDYPTDDPRVNELALIVISDLYDNRGMSEKVSGNVRRLVDDFSLQLRLSMRGDSNGGV